jgi:hypothetical protein
MKVLGMMQYLAGVSLMRTLLSLLSDLKKMLRFCKFVFSSKMVCPKAAKQRQKAI